MWPGQQGQIARSLSAVCRAEHGPAVAAQIFPLSREKYLQPFKPPLVLDFQELRAAIGAHKPSDPIMGLSFSDRRLPLNTHVARAIGAAKSS